MGPTHLKAGIGPTTGNTCSIHSHLNLPSFVEIIEFLCVRLAIEAASSCAVWTSGSMLRYRTTCNCYLRRVPTLSSVGRTRSVEQLDDFPCTGIS